MFNHFSSLGMKVLKLWQCFYENYQNGQANLLKSHFGMGVLLQICCIFSEHLFLRALLDGVVTYEENNLRIITDWLFSKTGFNVGRGGICRHLNAASSTAVTAQPTIFTWQWPIAKYSQTIKNCTQERITYNFHNIRVNIL